MYTTNKQIESFQYTSKCFIKSKLYFIFLFLLFFKVYFIYYFFFYIFFNQFYVPFKIIPMHFRTNCPDMQAIQDLVNHDQSEDDPKPPEMNKQEDTCVVLL